jgi:hypothetical protein
MYSEHEYALKLCFVYLLTRPRRSLNGLLLSTDSTDHEGLG